MIPSVHELIITKIQEIRPGATWTLRGDTYDGLEWLDDSATKPTAAELGL
jgi:hypothetical protein